MVRHRVVSVQPGMERQLAVDDRGGLGPCRLHAPHGGQIGLLQLVRTGDLVMDGHEPWDADVDGLE